jgi:hypothetical protein
MGYDRSTIIDELVSSMDEAFEVYDAHTVEREWVKVIKFALMRYYLVTSSGNYYKHLI